MGAGYSSIKEEIGMKLKTFLLTAIFSAVALSACSTNQRPEPIPNQTVQVANPATEYCTETKKGRSEIRVDEDGSQFAVCHLPDGTTVEEWELFRRDHPIEDTTIR